jgi:ribose 5-phosphate isomerase B
MATRERIPIASDHAGFDLKEYLKAKLPEIDWVDLGTMSTERTDYPDFAAKVAEPVSRGQYAHGVLVCGSGIGMCIAANKFAGVRAAVVESEQTARLSREHNDVNVLCVGARVLSPETAKSIVQAWLSASFEGGRHADRVRKIAELEKNNGTSPAPRKSPKS